MIKRFITTSSNACAMMKLKTFNEISPVLQCLSGEMNETGAFIHWREYLCTFEMVSTTNAQHKSLEWDVMEKQEVSLISPCTSSWPHQSYLPQLSQIYTLTLHTFCIVWCKMQLHHVERCYVNTCLHEGSSMCFLMYIYVFVVWKTSCVSHVMVLKKCVTNIQRFQAAV